MEIWQALVLGIIQGLSEFLPISSSGHLLLVEKFAGNSIDLQGEQMLFFNIMMHVGTLLAVLIAMHKKWVPLLRHPLNKTNLYIIIACVPTVLMAILFKAFAPSLIDGKYLGCGFILTSCLLYASDNFCKNKDVPLLSTQTIHFRKPNKNNKIAKSALYPIKTSILTGFCQGVAVLPGISRSGATISSLRLLGANKEDATAFSFLLSIPIIIGSALYESLPLMTGKTVLAISPWTLIVGMLSSFVFGLISIKFLLKLIENHSMTIFVIYTLLLGIAVSILPFLN